MGIMDKCGVGINPASDPERILKCDFRQGHTGSHSWSNDNPATPDHLLHLVLTWAARGLLAMTDDWRNRRVLLAGKRVSDEVEMAANTLYAQGLMFVTSGMAFAAPLGTIAVTNEGSERLAEWDAREAGAVETKQE